MSPPETLNDSTPLKVRRGKVESVDLYEVKDNELDVLEKGSPATIQLNFAIFLLSLAFTSIVALCTAEFKSDIMKMVFVFFAVIGVLMGSYLLLIWYKTRKSITETVNVIRERIKPTSISTATATCGIITTASGSMATVNIEKREVEKTEPQS